MSDAETRFKDLIQPIKDIAANWDIDIAENLGEYLEELEDLQISVDGGKSTLNFAEAALLIQGSTAIYSKKVEYLYQLVIQSLEFITSKKARNVNESVESSVFGKDKSKDEDYLNFDNDLSYLLLDDVIDQGKNIDLAPAPLDKSRLSLQSGRNSLTMDNSRLSMSLMHSMLNREQAGATLKLSSSMLDSSGALCIGAATNFANTSQQKSSLDISAISLRNESTLKIADPEYSGVFDDCDEWDGGDQAHEIQLESPHLNPALDVRPIVTDLKLENAKHTIDPEERNILFHDEQVNAQLSGLVFFPALDPHKPETGSRAIKKGRPYSIPVRLKHPRSKEIKICSLENAYSSSTDSILQSISDTQSGGVPPATKGLLNPLLLPTVKAIRRLQQQRRKAEKRVTVETGRRVPLRGETDAGAELSTVEQLWQNDYGDAATLQNQELLEPNTIEAQVDDEGMGFGGWAGDDDEYDAVGNDEGFAEIGDNLKNGEGEGLTQKREYLNDYEHLTQLLKEDERGLSERVEQVLREEMELSGRSSYESICKRYIENFHKGADNFARETQLSRRVSEWTNRLEPLLLAEETSPQYDIFEYSDNVLQSLSEALLKAPRKSTGKNDSNRAIPFSDIVEGQSSKEVCRVFLACLQLVNGGNLNIIPSQVGGGGPRGEKEFGGRFQVELLTYEKSVNFKKFFKETEEGRMVESGVSHKKQNKKLSVKFNDKIETDLREIDDFII